MADIFIVNRSGLITPADITPAIAAINTQIARDFAGEWNVAGKLYFAMAPAGAWTVTLADQIDEANDLGYHVDENGVVSAIIDVAACQAISNDWRQCLSHEVLEMLVDPACTRIAPDNATIVEVCDPVEGDSYLINGVSVSNFVLPAYFLMGGTRHFDHLGYLTGAATALRPGGYIEQFQNGAWTTKLGEHAQGYMATRANGRRAWRKRAAA